MHTLEGILCSITREDFYLKTLRTNLGRIWLTSGTTKIFLPSKRPSFPCCLDTPGDVGLLLCSLALTWKRYGLCLCLWYRLQLVTYKTAVVVAGGAGCWTQVWSLPVAEPAWLWDFPEVRIKKETESGLPPIPLALDRAHPTCWSHFVMHFSLQFLYRQDKKRRSKIHNLTNSAPKERKELRRSTLLCLLYLYVDNDNKSEIQISSVGGRSSCLNLIAPLPLPRVQCMKTQDHDVDDDD